MPRDDGLAKCQPCKGNSFRYIDWTQSPTPFDKKTPCPSKAVKEDFLKSKLTDKSKQKTLEGYILTEKEEDGLGDKNVPLTFGDVGLLGENLPQELKDFDDTHVWKTEMNSELAELEIQGKSGNNERRRDKKKVKDETHKHDQELPKSIEVETQALSDGIHKVQKDTQGGIQGETQAPSGETQRDAHETKELPHGLHKVQKYTHGGTQGETQAPSGETQKHAHETQALPDAIHKVQKDTQGGTQGDTQAPSGETQKDAHKTKESDGIHKVQKDTQGGTQGKSQAPSGETQKDAHEIQALSDGIHKIQKDTQGGTQGETQALPDGVHKVQKDTQEGTQGKAQAPSGETQKDAHETQALPDGIHKVQKDTQGGSQVETQVPSGETQKDAHETQALPDGIHKVQKDTQGRIQGENQALSGETQKDAHETQALPDGINKVQKDTQGGTQGETQAPSGETQKDAHGVPQGAQGDTLVQHENIQRGLAESAQKDTQALNEGAHGDVQSLLKIAQKKTEDRNAERKRKRLAKRKKLRRRDKKKDANIKLAEHDMISSQEITEPKTPKEVTLLDEEPITLGDLDAVTKRQYKIDEMWYRVQTGRFIPYPTRPLARHWGWHLRLKINNYIQKTLNPIDTLRARIYAKDVHGPLRGSVAWRKDAGPGWGCGCPALPCICHLHTTKPPKKIPKGISTKKRGAARSRLMERVEMRVRIEERLHEKLANVSPPLHVQSMEPLVCAGVHACVARQVLTRPLIEAAERARRRALQCVPCDPGCQAECINACADMVQMLRMQAAQEILSSYMDIQAPKKNDDDIEFIRGKCAEVKVEAPFPTKTICYRVEEVRRATNRMPHREARGDASGAGRRAQGNYMNMTNRHNQGNSWKKNITNGREDLKMNIIQNVTVAGFAASTGAGGGGGRGEEALGAAVDAAALTLTEDAAQSTTEISCSRVQKHRQMSRRKTRWEHYRDHFRDFRVALKDAKRTLAPSSNIWKLNNLKYWFASCWLSTKGDGMVCSDLQEEDMYPHLAKLIQEEERYRNVLNLKNYLISHDFNYV